MNAVPCLLPEDALTALSHRLIRQVNNDDFDPFMVVGHPALPETEKCLVRACFYYAIVMTPKVTLLLDNFGRGGMCDMALDEVTAGWKTEELLASVGTTFEQIRAGKAVLLGDGELPSFRQINLVNGPVKTLEPHQPVPFTSLPVVGG